MRINPIALCLMMIVAGCGGSAALVSPPPTPQVTAPAIDTTAAQNGAVIVTLSDSTAGATIYYTLDGSKPTANSPQYFAPFLVASNLTLNAMAELSGGTASEIATRTFAPNIPSGTLVWSDEFTNTTGSNAQPNPAVWAHDAGGPAAFGNQELESYCAWGSSASPCSAAKPNSYVGTDGYLHIVAENPSGGVYTSARLKTEGLFSVEYGRIETRIWLPEGQGLWPAFWLLGNNIATVNWPACGEQDVMEHIDMPSPDWVEGSVHGTGFIGSAGLGTVYHLPAGQTFAGWHTYGMIWSKGSVAYYIDDASHPYATFTTASIKGFNGAVWPFDEGQSNFIILNLAVGGDWPGAPNSTTPFPSQMLVDYVRVYTNGQ
jgi:beta-glucanase (GH16 family)